jgi:hypothetical protein
MISNMCFKYNFQYIICANIFYMVIKKIKVLGPHLDFMVSEQWILEARLLVNVNTVDNITTLTL